MQVSYRKPTVNDGKEMVDRLLLLPRDDGDGYLAPEARRHTIGCFHVALYGRKLRISAAGKILYDPRISRSPQLLDQDFVVNFATYTRIYTLYFMLQPVCLCMSVCRVHLICSKLESRRNIKFSRDTMQDTGNWESKFDI